MTFIWTLPPLSTAPGPNLSGTASGLADRQLSGVVPGWVTAVAESSRTMPLSLAQSTCAAAGTATSIAASTGVASTAVTLGHGGPVEHRGERELDSMLSCTESGQARADGATFPETSERDEQESRSAARSV